MLRKILKSSTVSVAPHTYLLFFCFLFSPKQCYCNQSVFREPEDIFFSPGIQRQTVNNTMDRTEELSSGRESWSLVSHLNSKLYCSGLSLISATFLGIIYGLWNLGHIRSSFIIKKYANSCAKTLTPKWLDSERAMRKEPSGWRFLLLESNLRNLLCLSSTYDHH